MKKLFVFLVLAVAMIGSAMAQSNAPAPTLAARNNPGYCEIYIPYTWGGCARDGHAFVGFSWDCGNSDNKTGYYDREGRTVPLPTLAFGGHIVKTKACVSAHDHNWHGSAANCVEVDGYQGYFILGPNPCDLNTDDCKRLPNGMLQCTGTVDPPPQY